MRQLIILFVFLTAGFLGLWTYKIYTPVSRPDEYAEGYDPNAGAWWDTAKIEVDDDWKLDPSIPLNYIPVRGENELYMVIDNNGNVIGYRKRTKQVDGSWLWQDVDPNIPTDYEPVEGLENVYKVTDADGNVKYYKYIRNEDGTFAFVEVDKEGNQIGKDRDATKIDGKHVHITGNIYQLLDGNGVVIGYDKRIDNGDGTFSWMDTTMPQTTPFSDLVSDFSLPESSDSAQIPALDTSGIEKAAQDMANANANAGGGTDLYNVNVNVNPIVVNQPMPQNEEGMQIINYSDGSHTETRVVKDTKTINGKTVVYETYVKNTYDDAGNLLETKTDGPYETTQDASQIVATGPLAGGSSSRVEATIDNEIARVSSSYNFRDDMAGEIAAKLNAQRTSNGISAVQTTDAATKIAKLRAADMAANDVGQAPLPTYGTLADMVAKFGIDSANPAENIWKATEMSTEDIHTRFQAVDNSRNVRMNPSVSQAGFAVVSANGYLYICEVFL